MSNGGFRYLKLYDKGGKIHVRVSENGETSLGSDVSRFNRSPIAVVQIDKFEGLDVIPTEDLISEIRRRYSAEDMIRMFDIHVPDEHLINLLKERLDG